MIHKIKRLAGWKLLLGAGLISLGLGMGQAQSWTQELLKHPSVLSASLQLRAAQAQLNALQSPVTLVGGGGYQNTDYVDGMPGFKDSAGWDATLTASFQLFPYGDAADQISKAEMGVKQAQLGFRVALSRAETQVLVAAHQLQLALLGKQLAQQGEQLALKSLEGTKLRASKGGTSPAELRTAESAYQEAQEQVRSADGNVRLAELNLSSWVGSAQVQLPENLKYPVPTLSAEQQNALFALEQTRIQVEALKRQFLPTFNARYTYQANANSNLTFSLDSSTLQPALTYKYDSTTDTKVLNSQLVLGLKFTLTPTLGEALSAADAQLAAAEATVKNAALTREVQEASLKMRHEQALRQLALKIQAVSNAALSLSEAQKREELGLSSPLETLKANLDLHQAQLAEQQARLDVLQKVLDAYQFYALPPIEVNP
ncbi:TolC family protein [Deinococcus roseus]|uniref:Transporter n=1 Tax=Deinococcus roseus TaxID=392414 RepID=A0ABQ2D5C5_9DEIO|nr:TolC family protein [Deinococcus roseus]GGJ46578.1 hypothetical protein GCM10008938_35920 [Deinococcus roseus]